MSARSAKAKRASTIQSAEQTKRHPRNWLPRALSAGVTLISLAAAIWAIVLGYYVFDREGPVLRSVYGYAQGSTGGPLVTAQTEAGPVSSELIVFLSNAGRTPVTVSSIVIDSGDPVSACTTGQLARLEPGEVLAINVTNKIEGAPESINARLADGTQPKVEVMRSDVVDDLLPLARNGNLAEACSSGEQ